MQSERPKIHKLYSSISSTYKTLLEYFIKREVIDSQLLHLVNYKDPSNFIPLENIYLGAKIAAINLERENDLIFRRRCLDF